MKVNTMDIRMKKTLSILISALFLIQGLLFFVTAVAAEPEANISLSLSTKEASLGAEVTVTLKYTCPVNTAYLYFNIYFDNDRLTFVPSSGQSAAVGMINETVDPGRDEDSRSITFTYKFKTKAVGSAEIYVSDVENYRLEPVPGMSDVIETGTSSVTLSIVEKQLSSNANLKAITPSVGTLSPAFSKDVTSYTVNVSNGTTVCYMDFSLEDRDAKAQLSGDEFLKVGDNVRTITVTAPNGNVKKYTVNVIRAAAAPATSAPTATPSSTASASTATPDVSAKTEAPSATPDGSLKPTEYPDDSEQPGGSVTPDESGETFSTPAGPGESPSAEQGSDDPESGKIYIGTYDIFGESIVLYNITDYLEKAYPGRGVLDASNFICAGNILKGLRAYENKNTQYLVYASRNGSDPALYLLDLTDRSMQRYIGGEKIFDAYDISEKSGPDSSPDVSDMTRAEAEGNYKYAVSELLDRSLAFGAGHKLFIAASIIILIVFPLMLGGIIFLKSKF